MNELKVQTYLVHEAIDQGGFAYKQNNRFKAGVHDLYVKLPTYSDCHIEVKYEHKLTRARTANLALTVPQRKFDKDVKKANGIAGWCFVINQRNGNYLIACSGGFIPDSQLTFDTDFCTETIHGCDVLFIKKTRNGPWPIHTIVGHIERSQKEMPVLDKERKRRKRELTGSNSFFLTETKTTTAPDTTAPTSSVQPLSSARTSGRGAKQANRRN